MKKSMIKIFVLAAAIAFSIHGDKKAGEQKWLPLRNASIAFEQPKAPDVKKEIPVLCYHNFTKNKNTLITVSRKNFEDHMRSLYDSGYHSILPDDLYDHLTLGKPLPSKPIVISFDDSRGAQYNLAEPVLEKYGFKGVFFIMTVCVNKPDYMSSVQLKSLSDKGNLIAAHTYDHPLVSHISDNQWEKQLEGPKIFLERIIQKPVYYFAYPYGLWTERAITELKKYGYKAAFQLSGKQSVKQPLYTIRRLMVQGNWSVTKFYSEVSQTFSRKQEY
jgi:peptidoglycan/xylan/chitin deacetylase (PgdA/CDA1 family)